MSAVELAYEEFGTSQSGRPPLVIVHGFLASSRNWRFVAEQLAAEWHVFAVDMRNHGASPHMQRMDYPLMADDLAEFLRRKGVIKTNVLGHSMGGKIAMWLALNRPEYLDKLIVVDIAPKIYHHSFDNTLNALKSLPLTEISNRKQAETFLASAFPDLSYRQFLLQNLILQDGNYRWRIDLDIFLENSHHIAGFPDSNHIQPYTGKTLFVAGSESQFVSSQDIHALFPNALLQTIPNAGHWLHVQQPAVFIEHVKKFMSGD